jgi:hypothetical protein
MTGRRTPNPAGAAGPVSGKGSDPAPGLDWRDRAHWGGGRLAPCRHCRQPAFCRDEHGRPAHKVCAEQALTAKPTSTDPYFDTVRGELSA